MKTYKIYRHPDGRAEAVKVGWSWPGGLFGFLWAPFKRLWWQALAGLLALVVLGLVLAATVNAVDALSWVNLAMMVMGLVYGFMGNGWRCSNLAARGYELAGTVAASSARTALANAA